VLDGDLSVQRSLPLLKTKPVRLATTVGLEEAIDIIASHCLMQVRGNEIGVMQGSDPEHVHQMRVGLRRLRLALELFSEIFPSGMALQEDLAWIAAELGATRNWEVLAFDTLISISKAFPEELDGLMRAACSIAEKQRRHTAIMVGSARYAHLMRKLDEWIQGVRSANAKDGGRSKNTDHLSGSSVRKLYSHVFERYRRKLLQRGEALGDGDSFAMHHVRITAKKLRYTAEFFQSLPAVRNAPALAEALNALLSTFGGFHDISCADTLLQQLAKRHPLAANGAHFARGYLASKSEENSKNVNRVWQRFCLDSALKKR